MPLPAVKLPFPKRVMPLRKPAGEFPELFQEPPAEIVTRPVKSNEPATLLIIMLPLVPPPTVVVPVTVNGKAPTVNVVPFPMVRLPVVVRVPMFKTPSVVVVAVPPSVKL